MLWLSDTADLSAVFLLKGVSEKIDWEEFFL